MTAWVLTEVTWVSPAGKSSDTAGYNTVNVQGVNHPFENDCTFAMLI